jgi:lysozyme
MEYSKDGLALTEGFECCRLVAYQDVGGVWTVGYGHTAGVSQGMTVTESEAERLLLADVQWACAAVNRLVSVSLTQGEFDALVDFVFNCGVERFEGSTLLVRLNAGDYAGAAAEFERWDQVRGSVVAGLLRRRVAEVGEFGA